jgi:hypothetical protein
MRLIFGSQVFIFMDALGSSGDSSLVVEVEATTYNCYYKVNMGRHEAPIPCAYKVPSISSNKSKILDVKYSSNLYSPHFKH